MISFSTVYFGSKGLGIYESVAKIRELGFKAVELRQEHPGSGNRWETFKRIQKDFPEMRFTVHAPLWDPAGASILNPAMGLTARNRKLLGDLLRGAVILEAENVVIHTGFREMVFFNHVAWLPRIHWPRLKMPLGKAEKGMVQFFAEAVRLAADSGARVLVENPPRSEMDDILTRREDFERIFSAVAELGLALDISHCMGFKNLGQMLELRQKIGEVHIAYTNTAEDLHLPIPAKELAPLKKIPGLKRIPLVLEHGSAVDLGEIVKEKAVVEKFLKSV